MIRFQRFRFWQTNPVHEINCDASRVAKPVKFFFFKMKEIAILRRIINPRITITFFLRLVLLRLSYPNRKSLSITRLSSREKKSLINIFLLLPLHSDINRISNTWYLSIIIFQLLFEKKHIIEMIWWKWINIWLIL